MSSARGARLLKALENYCNGQRAHYFDTKMIFSKLKTAQLSEGCWKGSFLVEPSMCNVGDLLHGGYMASVMDAVSLYALISTNNGRLSWTTNMNINYLKSVNLGETVNVESALVKEGGLPLMEVTLRDEAGVPVAKGTFSFIAGRGDYQKLLKDRMDFDIFEQ